MEKMTNQEAASGIEKRLAVSEEADREVFQMLLNDIRPFADDDCNKDYLHEVESFSHLYFTKMHWHRRIRTCAENGDSKLFFGGKSLEDGIIPGS